MSKKAPVRIANRDARHYVNDLEEFKGSNTYALNRKTNQGTEVYTVYSYGTHFPMYCHESGVWYGNRDSFSISTTKHQTQCSPYLDEEDMVWMDTESLRRIALDGIAGLAAKGPRK